MKLKYFLWFLSVLFTTVLSSKNYDSIHKKFMCIKHSKLLVESFNCSQKKINWMKAVYNIDGYLKPGVQLKNAHLICNLYRRGTNLEYRSFGPTNSTFDICGMLDGSWTHIMSTIMIKELRKRVQSENVFHPCPFSGHIYIHNATLDENVYSTLTILPDGDYIFNALLYTNINRSEHLLVETKSYVEIKPKGTERF